MKVKRPLPKGTKIGWCDRNIKPPLIGFKDVICCVTVRAMARKIAKLLNEENQWKMI